VCPPHPPYLSTPLVPEFKWAENGENIYLTVEVSDAKDLKVEIKDDQITFAANSQGKDYALDLKLKNKIDAEVRGQQNKQRSWRGGGRRCSAGSPMFIPVLFPLVLYFLL